MRIIFNAIKTNLGDTGGCRTIIESCLALRNLGHDCDVATTKNRYTWRKFKTIDHVPPCDICIAISVMDIHDTRHMPATHKLLWLRGPEWLWMGKEASIWKKMAGIRVVCNSTWLVNHLGSKGIPSQVCYAGVDPWTNTNTWTREPVIGCLYSRRKSKRWYEFEELSRALGTGYKYVAFGLDGCGDKFVSSYLRNPKHEDLVRLYNGCKYWFSPSVMEGFHNPPFEAMACGAIPIVTKYQMGGTADYVIDGWNGVRYDSVFAAAKEIDRLEGMEFLRNLYLTNAKNRVTEIGTRAQAMKTLIETITGGQQ